MRRTIASILKAYRIEHNLTQLEIAKEMGFTVGTYNRLEKGNTKVTTVTVDKIAKFLNMDVVSVRKLLK